MRASTEGSGVLIRAALDAGCRHLLIGLGGSATVEAGTGILRALGIRFLNEKGEEVAPGGAGLAEISTVDRSGLDTRLAACQIDLVCDVDNPLLGEEGAAAIFGPQKGATPDEVRQLERNLAHFAELSQQTTGKDVSTIRHGGAAGGIAAGLHAYLGATLHPGTELVLSTLDYQKHLQQCDVVITGEGKLDLQTLGGKGPYGLALQARQAGKLVVGLAGAIPRQGLERFEAFDALFALADGPMALEEALRDSTTLLENIAGQVGKLMTAMYVGRNKHQ
jgi:glycerate kinase